MKIDEGGEPPPKRTSLGKQIRLTFISPLFFEAFVAADVRSVAYADRELPSQAGDARRQLLSPLTFARLAELADFHNSEWLKK